MSCLESCNFVWSVNKVDSLIYIRLIDYGRIIGEKRSRDRGSHIQRSVETFVRSTLLGLVYFLNDEIKNAGELAYTGEMLQGDIAHCFCYCNDAFLVSRSHVNP